MTVKTDGDAVLPFLEVKGILDRLQLPVAVTLTMRDGPRPETIVGLADWVVINCGAVDETRYRQESRTKCRMENTSRSETRSREKKDE